MKSNAFLDAILMYDSLITHYNNESAKYKLANLKYKTNKNFDSLSEFNDIASTLIPIIDENKNIIFDE